VATKAPRPGRRLIVFLLLVGALFGGVALGGQWTPKLGLDLQGGTRITLEASTATGDDITPEKMEEARDIIDQRVNGQGVAEAEVAVQGGNNIVVEIPGESRSDLVDSVQQTAQLRFRLVAARTFGLPAQQGNQNGQQQGQGNQDGQGNEQGESAGDGETAPSGDASPRGRALSGGLVAADDQAPVGNQDQQDQQDQQGNQAEQGGATEAPVPAPEPGAIPGVTPEGAPVDQPLRWMDDPGQEWLQRFADFTCPAPGEDVPPVEDRSGEPLITCDENGVKYLLSAAMIQGTQLTGAEAFIPQQQAGWIVTLNFNATGRDTFARVTREIALQPSPITQEQKQFAIVLDGQVISAPTVEGVIPNGEAQISGDFTQTEAQALANSLRYGALPLTFTAPVVSEEGPSLASDQLTAGLVAGGIGIALVLLYCMVYYRGLGIVVVASLGVAGAITYAVVLAMSQAVNFTLTLPGIAGLIIGVGITADSFVVYFERIRDEMRDGKSMRVAVEAGWLRARATCLAADAVSLLAAVVLYIFAIGVVKGFAFALGISTVIDLVVFFLFTKPMVTWLARFKFFNTGHKWSGLSPESVGRPRTDRPGGAVVTPVTGGNA
jgi:preprotein translocase subunit SecD